MTSLAGSCKSPSPEVKNIRENSYDELSGRPLNHKINNCFNEKIALSSFDKREVDTMTKNILRNASPADRLRPGFTSHQSKYLGGGHKDVLSKLTNAISIFKGENDPKESTLESEVKLWEEVTQGKILWKKMANKIR